MRGQKSTWAEIWTWNFQPTLYQMFYLLKYRESMATNIAQTFSLTHLKDEGGWSPNMSVRLVVIRKVKMNHGRCL